MRVLRAAVTGREKRVGEAGSTGGWLGVDMVDWFVQEEDVRHGLSFYGVGRDPRGGSPGIGDVCCRSVSLLLTITEATATKTKTKRTSVPP